MGLLPIFQKGMFPESPCPLKRVPTGTQINFYHSNVPAKAVKSITDGWKTFIGSR